MDFQSPQTRLAIEQEMSDLLKSESAQHPALIQVSLSNRKYKQPARHPCTLVAKRKSVGLYMGILCVRGDVSPLTVATFISSPMAHSCGIKILRTLATCLRWHVRALGISQSFLQSGNLRPAGRIVAIPHPTVTLPWAGHLPPVGTDLKTLAPSPH